MNASSAMRKIATVGLATGALGAVALGAASSASAQTVGRQVQIGPAYGIQCVSAYATHSVYGSGYVTMGSGANFQLRFSGYQLAGSGAQVYSFSASTGSGYPNWFGPGYYEFCARNNGSNATAQISITAS